ncbi:MAG TPA: type II secretion system protein GspJ [Candidatus Limnocylindrales bacterium]|nr:type II secretion system protein GspJ [Candidatus Limnocylindrales bacterium]
MKLNCQSGRESRVESRGPTRDAWVVFCSRPSSLDPRLFFRAFTLVEMILAVGVAALVLAVVGGVFFAALHLREETQAAVDGATPVDQALSVMRRDLECAVTPTNGTTKVLSGDFRVGTLTSPGISQPVAIEMFTATGALRDNAPWGDIQKVTYELRDSTDHSAAGKDLYRSVTRNIMAVTMPDVDDQWMLGGVQSIEFSCFDGSQWSDTWDTTGITSVNTNLPLAVRVRIQPAGNNPATTQPIEMLVPVDSQSRTNAVL